MQPNEWTTDQFYCSSLKFGICLHAQTSKWLMKSRGKKRAHRSGWMEVHACLFSFEFGYKAIVAIQSTIVSPALFYLFTQETAQRDASTFYMRFQLFTHIHLSIERETYRLFSSTSIVVVSVVAARWMRPAKQIQSKAVTKTIAHSFLYAKCKYAPWMCHLRQRLTSVCAIVMLLLCNVLSVCIRLFFLVSSPFRCRM